MAGGSSAHRIWLAAATGVIVTGLIGAFFLAGEARESHGQASGMESALAADGFGVARTSTSPSIVLSAKSTPPSMIVVAPGSPLTTMEKARLVQYVEDGGHLCLITS